MDSTDVDPSGGTDRRHHSYTNSAFSSQPSPPEPACKACGGSFDAPARKVTPPACCSQIPDGFRQEGFLLIVAYVELVPSLGEELVELVLSQQSSPSSSSAPDTPIVEPSAVTSDPTTRISISDSASDASSPAPPTPEPEAPPTTTETPPSDAELEDDDPAWDPEEAPVSGRRASLSDLKSVDNIEELSVRQLKEILARNFVDYKGCCEKWELMERVTRLYQDQQNLLGGGGGPAPGQEENLCKICMDSPIDCVLLECGHMVTCTKCGKRMSECPICRQYVIRAVHVFRS
ncbi:hypothetical protein XENOCAPTIV_011339 [Xenoophorus captivus]|uniref:RING-type domain-containing protein n=1 Tax=Xenoophorus captivus TaxID=1517983 RepID=A0ABV0R860_9TELE